MHGRIVLMNFSFQELSPASHHAGTPWPWEHVRPHCHEHTSPAALHAWHRSTGKLATADYWIGLFNARSVDGQSLNPVQSMGYYSWTDNTPIPQVPTQDPYAHW